MLLWSYNTFDQQLVVENIIHQQLVDVNDFRRNIMKNSNERLKKLRIDRGITQKEMAEILEMTVTGYQYYEHGKREISVKALTALADYFNVSTDYLLGRTDDPKRY